VLEAMRVGTPVVASDIPAVREVAGDAALYVPRPFDPSCWGDVLESVCTDPTLREQLARRGLDAAPRFRWEQVGREFSSLLHTVAVRGALDGSGIENGAAPAQVVAMAGVKGEPGDGE
jgi:glycosyltransferase involved in cell wall biosynthesis